MTISWRDINRTIEFRRTPRDCGDGAPSLGTRTSTDRANAYLQQAKPVADVGILLHAALCGVPWLNTLAVPRHISSRITYGHFNSLVGVRVESMRLDRVRLAHRLPRGARTRVRCNRGDARARASQRCGFNRFECIRPMASTWAILSRRINMMSSFRPS